MSPAAKRRNGGEGDGVMLVLPLIGLAGGAFVGVPGLGLYVGLLLSVLAFKLGGTRNESYESAFGALSKTVPHPFSSLVRTGADKRWWPPNRLSAWWSAFAAALLAAVPLVIHASTTLALPHRLTSPGLALVSFVGYYVSIHAIVAALRRDKPAVIIEKDVLKEKRDQIIEAAVVGATAGVIAFFALGHASTIRSYFSTGHTGAFTGKDAFAGLGTRGAVGVSIGVGLLMAFALASLAYKKAWLAPHVARTDSLNRWEVAWRAAVGNMAPPIFISEARTPEDEAEVCSALFQVPPGMTVEAYQAKADKLAPVLGVDSVLVKPDYARDKDNKPMLGGNSATVFKATYPLVPMKPGAHLDHEFTEKGPLYDYIVESTFRGIFDELRLGQPNLVALTILTDPESPGRLVETMWTLATGTTFDQVAKATNSILEKSGARWLRVGRRSTMYPDEEVIPGAFVSVLFGDPPQEAEFADSKVFSADEHRRFIEMIDWDARFRSVGLASAVSGPTLVASSSIDNDLREFAETDIRLRVWTFTYPAGLSQNDVLDKMDALKASGLAFVAFRRTEDDPNKFQLITGDGDPLALAYAFLKAAPKILRRPKLGHPRLTWAVGVGPAGELVEFEFGTEDPHLLIGGATGSGKSMAIISMLLQLATANETSDVQFRLVDPKTALVPFRNLAHVSHFVMNRPGRDQHHDFLDLLADTVKEMENRYERLNELGLEDLTQARAIGHMTDVPYVLVVVEEVSLMLRSHDRQLERDIVEQVGRIANLGRGAGVYLVLATQYPSNQSVPNHLREQFSRIGFKVQDHVASKIIINESGLEDLVLPGQGKMRCGGLYTPFRGFFLHPGDGPTNLDKAGEEELKGVVHNGRAARPHAHPLPPAAGVRRTPRDREGQLGAGSSASCA